MKEILHKLQQCLIEEDYLSKPRQPWPCEQIYKVSVIKLLLYVRKYSKFSQPIHNVQSIAFKIYSRLLIAPEAEIQNIAWSAVSEILTKESKWEKTELLGNCAVDMAVYIFQHLDKRNPDVRDALFDFLYNCLMNADKWWLNVMVASDKKREICILVLRNIHSHNASNIYLQRINYLRLLGKCMTTVIHELKVRVHFYTFVFPCFQKNACNTC